MTTLAAMFPSGWAMASFALREKLAHPEMAGWVLVAAPGRRVSEAWAGLSGMDRAAQAGMLQSRFARIRPQLQVVIAASCAPPAVRRLAQDELAQLLVHACGGHRGIARALVRKFFGAKIVLRDVADRYGVHRNTLSRYSATVSERLGEVVDLATLELEQIRAEG